MDIWAIMKHIGIVECISTGRLYVNDIIAKGFRPLIINTMDATEHCIDYRRIISAELEGKVDFIDEEEDFDSFVEKLKGYDLEYVFPGSERGVRLADRIIAALGLIGNDEKTTYLRCTKEGMFEALGKANIRRINTAMVGCEEDLIKFWDENDLEKVVLKFSESASTVGLKICGSKEEAIDHLKKMLVMPDSRGKINSKVLAQEYIGGTEYIVNTLSCNGKHMLTDIWVYSKIRSDDGTLAYDYAKLVKDLEPGHTDMIRYAYKVLDAVEMKWGLCHIEIKIDRKGPVLIETNARPMGLGMTAAYLDEALGHHYTDIALDVYMHPDHFDQYAMKRYAPLKYALMKTMIVPEDIVGSFAPTFVISNMVRSTRELLYFGKEGVGNYPRTIDLNTSPLAIKMINKDYGALMRDYELLRLIESNYFHLFYTLSDNIEASEPKTDLDTLIKILDPIRRFLLVTNDGNYLVQYGKKSEMDRWMIFDGAIYAKCTASTTEDRYVSIYRTMHSIRSGGAFIVVPEAYENMKDGSVIMDFLMNIAGFQIMAPSYNSAGIMYGVKQ